MKKELGKITKAKFGLGGYDGVMIGLHLTFSIGSSTVNWTKSDWDPEIIKLSEHTQWSEADRDANFSEIVRYLSKVLNEAKVDSVDRLIGIPVEITLDGNTLKSWRVLTEVL